MEDNEIIRKSLLKSLIIGGILTITPFVLVNKVNYGRPLNQSEEIYTNNCQTQTNYETKNNPPENSYQIQLGHLEREKKK